MQLENYTERRGKREKEPGGVINFKVGIEQELYAPNQGRRKWNSIYTRQMKSARREKNKRAEREADKEARNKKIEKKGEKRAKPEKWLTKSNCASVVGAQRIGGGEDGKCR